jgi:hypothetical protein
MSAFANYRSSPVPTPATLPAVEYAAAHGIPLEECKDLCKPKVTLDMVRKVHMRREAKGGVAIKLLTDAAESVEASAEPAKTCDPEVLLCYDYELVSSRTQPRLATGEMAIECAYDGYKEKVPLTSFIDGEGWFTDAEVCQMVNDWCETAKKFPDTKRCCLMCKTKATKGLVVCWRCEKVWGASIYAE